MSLDWDKFKEAQYNYVKNNRAPCDDGYTNQCALRVSNSLLKAGWPFNGAGQKYDTNRFGPLCSHGRARGAQSLADYLEVYLKYPKKYVRPTNPDTRELAPAIGVFETDVDGNVKFIKFWDYFKTKAANGQKLRGIIFFNGTDHIDGFDLQDTVNTHNTGGTGIIGEEYADAAFEIRVFFT